MVNSSDPTRRMRVRDIAAARKENISKMSLENGFTTAGLPTKNFGKPFAYA